MIAVFASNHKHLQDIDPIPKEMFVRIRGIQDIRGRRFTGVIFIRGWYEDRSLREARDYIEEIQPELFKNQ